MSYARVRSHDFAARYSLLQLWSLNFSDGVITSTTVPIALGVSQQGCSQLVV